MKKLLKEARLKINTIGAKRRYQKLKIKNPTIISNNCWAGIVSQYLGVKYYTPTIGLYFYADEYIKFLSNFNYYVKLPIKVIETEKSRHYEEMKNKKHEKAIVGVLDDVEIVFLHYKTKEEVLEKWKRRVERINYDCIIFKFCNQNSCTDELIKKFDELPLNNKICFSSKEYKDLKSVIWIKEDNGKKEVERDYYKSHKYLNIIEYINNIYENGGGNS